MAKVNTFILSVILAVFSINQAVSQSDFYNTNSIREVRIYFNESNWDHILDSLHEYVGEDGRLLGDVTLEGQLFHNIGVRYKGYSSFDPDAIKSPFNIDLEYNYNNQNYQGHTKLKLSNVIQDPSFVREVLSYEIARKYVPASLANFANVYVNDTLIGLYTNVEAVDKSFLNPRFHGKDNSFFKGAPESLIIPDGQNANLVYYDTDTTSYKPFYKLESDDSETSWVELLRFIGLLNNDTANIDTILNIDRALWMHAINYTLVNLDSYIGYSQNYYLYMDNFGRFNPIVWDFNMSFGSFNETDGLSSPPGGLTILKRKALDPLKMVTSTPLSPRPLITNLLRNTTQKRMYLAHMRTIINENFKNNFYLTRGMELQNMIDTFVQNDPNKFYPYSQFYLNLDTTVGSGNNIFPGIRDFMEARIAYLDSFPGFAGAPVISGIAHDPESPSRDEQVWIRALVAGSSEVFLGYRYQTDGIFIRVAMFDDGDHHDSVAGDGIYGAGISTSGATVQYYIYAQNDSAGIFSPERAEYEFYSIQPQLSPGDIVFNEIMALNANTIKDQDNEYDGWMELYNTTSEDQNLKNLFLTDDIGMVNKWVFPDTIVPAKSFIVVWADDDVAQDGLHTGFSLTEEGDGIYLLNDDDQIIDKVEYGLQVAGKTYGRYPNGYGAFAYMIPTFARNNYVGTSPSADILLYPNPAAGEVVIEMISADKILAYAIYDSQGQQVISSDLSLTSKTGSELYKIDVSFLNSGLYIIMVETTNHSISKRFIVVN